MNHSNSNKISSELTFYLKVLATFFAFSAFSLLVFGRAIHSRVDDKVIQKITDNITLQSSHFNSIIALQYRYMEGIAEHLSEQDQLITEENMSLIHSISETGVFEKVSIIEPDGTSNYDNGEVKNVKDRDYFRETMNGNICLSDPLESMVDQETRVILSVPITRGDTTIGMIAGSYNVGSLNQLLFDDAYDGNGYSMITTGDGTIISIDGDTNLYSLKENDNFLEYYASQRFGRDSSQQKIVDNFNHQQGGAAKMKMSGGTQYLSYAPLSFNGWMLCYVVHQDVAVESYSFIEDYEMVLLEVLALGFVIMLLILFRHIRRSQNRLLHRAHVDALTDIYNKNFTETAINQWLESDSCSGLQCFMMMDVDEFKEINDTHGHLVGDKVLQQIGVTLRSHFREGDIIGRIGGDEFVILMKNIPTRETAEIKAALLCNAIQKLVIKEYPSVHITISVGLAFAPEQGHDFTTLYQSADHALYETKQSGRNGYTVFKKGKAL
jgi:diguanylate cyclase (GGDEF)-like protein